VALSLTDDARTLLGNLGYDPTYGARPLKRVIQKQLVDRLAMSLLRGEYGDGDVVEADGVDGEIVIRTAVGEPAVAA
jgi:ATP-dependent Clp protease ATP-binding subunit ClpB